VKLTVRAPATTANLGAAFDCAAVALDLWNEVVISDGGTPDREHLGVRAFERIDPADGLRFEFFDRIPRERGLGSSAAVIALGLLAAAHVGGACLTSGGRIHRVADGVPAVPIALVPDSTVATADARAALPEEVPLGDAVFSVGRSALLGAGLAAHSEEIFGAALDDRLHEPYRAQHAPLLEEVRREPPVGALGATISGSGPTVIVWATHHEAEHCSVELSNRFPDVEVLWLSTSPKGAGLTS
jgi:homoserine kinase